MGLILDSSLLINLERRRSALPQAWLDEEIGIAAITAAELLAGVLRADPARRPRRTAFVESILDRVPVFAFDLRAARVFAAIEFELASIGERVDRADLQIAATAVVRGWAIATLNTAHFARVPGLALRSLAGDET